MKKRILISLIFILLLMGIIITIIVFYKPQKTTEKISYYIGDCIYKGNDCSFEEINKGILISVPVNENANYDFYVLDDSTDEMTLILNKNINSKIDWHGEITNIKGPTGVFEALYYETAGWTNIPLINYYKYEDYGNKYFINACNDDNLIFSEACEKAENGSGYENFTIIDGNMKVLYNDRFKYTNLNSEFENIRARTITIEELSIFNDVGYPNWLSSNLSDNSGYWTLSSSFSNKTGFSQGAYAFVKSKNNSSVETLYVLHEAMNEDFKIGVRPVITILKEEK